MVRVLIYTSGAPHQSQAPSSEIRGGKSSEFKIRGAPSVRGGKGGGKGGGGGAPHRYTDTPCHPPCPDRRIGVFASWIGVSAYRRIFAPGSAYRRIFRAYRRIGVFFPRTGISASGVPAYARIGVSQPRPPPGVSAYRMCPLRAMRRRFGVSAQGGFATLFAGTLVPHRAIVYYAYPLAFLCRSCHPHASLRDAARWSWNQSGHRRLGVVGCGNRVQPVIGILQGSN